MNVNHDKARLTGMLNEKKITEDDYKILLEAMDKPSLRLKLKASCLLNPFQKIAGVRALGLGLLMLLAMSYLGVLAQTYFLGPLSIVNASVITTEVTQTTFLFLLFQLLVGSSVLSLIFIATSKLLKKTKLRVLDFFGTVAFAHFPYVILMGLMAAIRLLQPSFLEVDLSQGLPIHASIPMMLFGLVTIASSAWQLTVYFFALKESSGLTGKKLGFGFVLAMILAELGSQQITTFFMH